MNEYMSPDSLNSITDEDSLLADFDAEYFHSIDLGPVNLLLSSENTGEVIYNLAVTSIPHAPPHLVGIANIRGKTVPVFTLDDALEDEVVYSDAEIFLILQKGKDTLALRIPALPTRVRADSAKDVTPVLNLNSRAHPFVLRAVQFEKPSMLFDSFNYFSSLAS